MAYCPHCGSLTNDGAKFCGNCGGVLQASQPQAVQPVAQPQPQQQPQAQPQPQPVNQQPVQQAVPPVAEPVSQPVQNAPKTKNNGLCTAGFVLSLLGVFLFGITTLFGLIFSVIGLISVGKKKENGKGKAIAGIILSLFMVIVVVAGIIVLKTNNPVTDFIGRTFGIYPNYKAPDYEDFATKEGWIVVEDESYIVFDAEKNTVKYCMSYLETEDFYISGHYKMLTGKKAFKYLTEELGDSGITKDKLDELIGENEEYFEDSLIAITCDYEEYIYDGEVQDDFEPKTTHLYGFYTLIDKNEQVFDAIKIYNLGSGGTYTLIKENQFWDYRVDEPDPTDATEETSEPTDWTDPINETDFTDPEDETDYTDPEDETEPTENTASDYENIVGDSITGTVTLVPGAWAVWQEADGGLDGSILSRYQRMNIDTETIFNLTTFDIKVDPDSVSYTAESAKQNLESEGVMIKDYGETTIGGYKAYIVTGKYQDGMNLSVWFFADSNGYLHYISVEYYDSDYASYEMVRDTYTL